MSEWHQWLAQGETLEQDMRGPKVIRLTDGRILKVFRPRRRLWLARLLPAAKRFATNAGRLRKYRIAAPVIGECFWVDRHRAVSGCLYEPLPGMSMEQLYQNSRSEFDELLPGFAAFVRTLHQRGIYFRSLHLGNVLHLPDGRFGLIDFLDMRFHRGPLPSRLVHRNFAHLRSYLVRSEVKDFPWEVLQAAYADTKPS